MERKATSGIMVTLLFIGMLTLAFNITYVKADNDPEFTSFNIDIGRKFVCGVAITPDSKKVYVMNEDPTMSVIDATIDSFVKIIDLSSGSPGMLSGGSVVVNGKLFALGSQNVVIMDVATEHVIGTIPQAIAGGISLGRAVTSPAMDRVYTVFGSASAMLAIDTLTNQLIGSVDIGNQNTGIGVSPSGDKIYISDWIRGHLTIVDACSFSVITIKPFTDTIIGYSTAVAVGSDGMVYVGYVDSTWKFAIAVLDSDGNLKDTVTTPAWSEGLEISKDGKYLVTGNGMIIDVETRCIVAHVNTGIGGYQVSMSPDGLRAYVTNANSEYVTVIEGFLPPTPKDLIQRLIETIHAWNLPQGTENSLTSKLEDALHLLNIGNENGAIHKLMDFIDQVEALRGKKLTSEQANQLTSEAQRIIDLIKG